MITKRILSSKRVMSMSTDERTTHTKELIKYFRQEAAPHSPFGPLYKRIFGEVSSRIEQGDLDWLVNASSKRTPLEVSLLLLSGLHRQVLVGREGTQALSKYYYPSVGGEKHQDSLCAFEQVLFDTIQSQSQHLVPIIQNETVQTNETGRGQFWLLPAILSGFPKIHLVELGTSAGLNLVADQRRFTYETSGHDGPQVLTFGLASSTQFVSQCSPFLPSIFLNGDSNDDALSVPEIVSRSGCDLRPFSLETEEGRTTLKSFIWPDQPQRLARFEEGIEAYTEISRCQRKPIVIKSANLPHGLPDFLRSLELSNDIPTVIYNTYMATYLENDGLDLEKYIQDWVNETDRTILWAQSETFRGEDVEIDPENFQNHWCLWSVRLFEKDCGNSIVKKKNWNLAWTHPHGHNIEWLEGINDFVAYFGKHSS